jgi:hypothetical protein
MSLSTILKEIETNRPNAEMDVAMGNPQTLGGRQGLKRAATEAVKRLTLDYRKELLASTSFIVVTGTARDSFVELASGDTFGCFSSDPERFFKDLTSRIDSRLFGREGAKQLFNIADNILYDKAMELDLASYNGLAFNDKYNRGVKTAQDFEVIVRDAIVDQVGSEIVGIDAVYSLATAAIKKGHEASVTPVILGTDDEKFALDLYKNLKTRILSDGMKTGLTPNVFLVVAGKASKEVQKLGEHVKAVNEASVAEALTSIRNRVQ